jgi:hypothetical protein
VSGPSYNASKLQTSVKWWLEMANMGLSKKYGPPTRKLVGLDSFNIFDCKSDRFNSFLEWKIRNKTISIGVSVNESKYTPEISYMDDEIAAKRFKDEKPSSNF